jgi:hypothetical protein
MIPKGVINLYFYDPYIITPEEYRQIERDVRARYIAGLREPGDGVLIRLLKDHESRCLMLEQEQ